MPRSRPWTSPRASIRPRIWNALLAALFLLGITLPGLALLSGFAEETGLSEKRRLAPLPAVPDDLHSLERFPRGFEAYYRDHFGFRSLLVRNYNRIFRRWLKISNSEVVVGKEGWLYLDTCAAEYRFADPFSERDVEDWRRNLEQRADFLERRGIDFVFAIVPNKDMIHPEYLPDSLQARRPTSRKEQLIAALAGTRVEPVDLAPAAQEAKRRAGRAFLATDTHWNELGAHAAYEELLGALAERHPALSPRPLSDFEVQWVRVEGGDLAGMLALKDEVEEEIPKLVPRQPPRAVRVPVPEYEDNTWLMPDRPHYAMETGDESLPRAVMFRDSFSIAMVPFLSEHFSRIVYIWSDHLIGEIIEAEQPDIVIWEMAERKFVFRPVPVNSEAVAKLAPVFDAGESLLSIDATNAREELELVGDARWRDDVDGAVLRVKGRHARALLPRLDADPDDRVILRLRFESALSTYTRLFYGDQGSSGFDRLRSVTRTIHPGSYEFYFEVPGERWDGRLALMIGNEDGDYALQAIEVRRMELSELRDMGVERSYRLSPDK